jgi:hypothetical protein
MSPVAGDHRHLASDEVGGERRQARVVVVGPPIFDDDVLALDEPGAAQTFLEGARIEAVGRRRALLRNPTTGTFGVCARTTRPCAKGDASNAVRRCAALVRSRSQAFCSSEE